MSWWNSDPVADASPLEMAKTTANAWWQNDPVADEKPKIPEQDTRITELQKPGAVPMTADQKRALFARRF